jgi:hypothetical protein
MARTGLTARYVHGYMYIHVMHVVWRECMWFSACMYRPDVQ